MTILAVKFTAAISFCSNLNIRSNVHGAYVCVWQLFHVGIMCGWYELKYVLSLGIEYFDNV